MKVVSITTAFPRSDSDVLIPWIIRLINLLKEKGVETDVFTSSYRGRPSEICKNIKVFRFRYFFRMWEKLSHDMSVPEKLKSNKLYFLVLPFFLLFGILSARKYAKKHDFDLIHVHFPFPLALFGIAMKNISKKPLLVTCHGSEVNLAKKNTVFRTFFARMLKKADAITVNSRFMKDEVEKIIGNGEIHVIPMGSGIGEKKYEASQNPDKIKVSVLFVGRLIKLKGADYLIKAMQRLDPDKFELHIVGDGPERENLEKIAQKNIFFYGYKTGTELENLYKDADIFVLPSIVDNQGFTEGLGTVLLEAASFHIPIIASNVGGIPDIVINEKTGLLVPEKDPEAIAKAILRIDENKKLAKELCDNAISHIQACFSWEKISEKFLSLYKSLI